MLGILHQGQHHVFISCFAFDETVVVQRDLVTLGKLSFFSAFHEAYTRSVQLLDLFLET